jgi:cytidylate kinase
MKIIVSGLTAAGKTTLCHRLARTLDLPYFSGSDALRTIIGNTEDQWSPGVDRQRTSLELEREVDLTMIGLLRDRRSGVFDAWGLPWFTLDSALRIWLESDEDSRLRKCYVSYLERGLPKSMEECFVILHGKDSKSRSVFAANWGFDLFTDRSPFDAIVDCSALIPTPTESAALRGADATYRSVIRAFAKRNLVAESLVDHDGSLGDHAIIDWLS